MNHASNVLGVAVPLGGVAAFAKAHGLMVLVDVAQSAGQLDIDADALGIDLVAGTGHKGLLGPSGIGFLYVRDPDRVAATVEGGSGSNSASLRQPEFMPVKFEAGTLNYMGIAGLLGSLKHANAVGRKAIYAREMRLMQKRIGWLRGSEGVRLYGDVEPARKVPLVSLCVEGWSPSEVEYQFNAHGVCARPGLHCAPLIHQPLGTMPSGTVRVCCGHTTTDEEVEALVKIVEEVAAAGQGRRGKREVCR